MDATGRKERRRSWLAITVALLLIILGSLALFALIENLRPYVAFVRGQFFSAVANSSETVFTRAFSRTGVALLQFALWPALLFIVIETSAAYCVSTVLHINGRLAALRRFAGGYGLSVLSSLVLLVALWAVLERLVFH